MKRWIWLVFLCLVGCSSRPVFLVTDTLEVPETIPLTMCYQELEDCEIQEKTTAVLGLDYAISQLTQGQVDLVDTVAVDRFSMTGHYFGWSEQGLPCCGALFDDGNFYYSLICKGGGPQVLETLGFFHNEGF